MKRKSVATVMALFLFTTSVFALGSYDSGTAYTWADLDKAFAKFFFFSRRSCQSQREQGNQPPLFGSFIFCDDGSGTYRWAMAYGESTKTEAEDTARRYLMTSGSCRGSIKSYSMDQWEKEDVPTPRLSDYTPPPKSQAELAKERFLKTQQDQLAELDRRISTHKSDKAFASSGKALADWALKNVKLQNEREALLKKQAQERKRVGLE